MLKNEYGISRSSFLIFVYMSAKSTSSRLFKITGMWFMISLGVGAGFDGRRFSISTTWQK